MSQGPDLLPNQRQTFRRQGKILMYITAVVRDEMVVQKVFVGCCNGLDTRGAVEEVDFEVALRRHANVSGREDAEADIQI